MNIEEATEAIQHKFIKNFGENLNLEIEVEQAYQMISKLIVDHATQVFKEEARRLDGIILAGGGASVVYPHLKHIWPSTIVPENPRFSVADGYVRYGIGFIAAEYRRKAAQDANLKAVA
jgi:plasmid segregation protein ParM